MKNYKDIISNFDKVISAKIENKNSLIVTGIRYNENEISNLVITYVHPKVAKEVQRLVQYFIKTK